MSIMQPDYWSPSGCSTASPGGGTLGCSLQPLSPAADNQEVQKKKKKKMNLSFYCIIILTQCDSLPFFLPPGCGQRRFGLSRPHGGRHLAGSEAPPAAERGAPRLAFQQEGQSRRLHEIPEGRVFQRRGRKEADSPGEEQNSCGKMPEQASGADRRPASCTCGREKKKSCFASKSTRALPPFVFLPRQETDQLEDEKSSLRSEIDELLKEKERLERTLSSHESSCKLDKDDEGERDVTMPSPESDAEGPRVPAAVIFGNSDILLCSGAEDDETPEDDLDDLVPETEAAAASGDVGAAAGAFVPDVGDLSGALCLPDWETLYRSVADDLRWLSGNFRTCGVFSFGLADTDALAEGGGSGPEDGLNSPTLLTL
ncbi:protein c-Fos-like isoform X1 [Phyllopteryx taeniolatus]|uniref:protein c-Fos-like isoform X1 n=1 Tax=Phyllopteryx taeniolatus TaxID=161469 RepID=UPI002AD1FB36|nr:protein c-Fos-like isoform X1 [Phyllopteryx taeniolatus]